MRLGQLAFILLVATAIHAQTGSWNVLNAKLKLSRNWGLFTESELRSLSFYNNFFYYELKGGVSYKLSKNISVAVGMGTYQTFSPGGNFKAPKVNDEFRTWLQLNLTQDETRLKIEHRYRMEQKWASNGFFHSLRYKLNASLPLGNKNIAPKTFYLNSSDEIFFTPRTPYFVGNRFFAGSGYKFTKSFACQAGYMQQFVISASDKTRKGFFHISFLFSFDWKNKMQ